MTTKIVIGLEMQIPYEDRRMFYAFLKWIREYKPDQLIMIGDFLDVPGPSRWNRGTAAEYLGTLGKESEKGTEYLYDIRSVYDGWIGYHSGANHEARIQSYINNQAPAFAGLHGLSLNYLLSLDKFEIEELPTYYRAGPGLITSHGDKESLGKLGGSTALAGMRNKGSSFICGHTHRHGLIYERFGLKTLFGMETGHMMSAKKAKYIKNENPNWSAGWGVVEINGNQLSPHIITYRNGRVNG